MREHRSIDERVRDDVEDLDEATTYAELANNARAGYSVLQDLRPWGVTPTLHEMYDLANPLAENGRGFLNGWGATNLGRLGVGLSAVNAVEHGAEFVGDLQEHGTEAFSRRETYNHLGDTLV